MLITGGAGFIGSNFVKEILKSNEIQCSEIIVVDSLTYAGSLENFTQAQLDSFRFEQVDISDSSKMSKIMPGVDLVVNFAAESHVDRSIEDSSKFIRSNIVGVNTLLNLCKEFSVSEFLQISTDEVYGSIKNGSWTEESPIKPNSPYAASKASADLLVRAFAHTHSMNVKISRCCNNYGPNQFPEKFIPKSIIRAYQGLPIELYGDGSNVREWIHVSDHCRAISKIITSGEAGGVYNVGSGFELTNLDLAKKITHMLGDSSIEIKFIKDRLGHDLRYSLEFPGKISNIGFTPQVDFETGLKETCEWYLEHFGLGASL